MDLDFDNIERFVFAHDLGVYTPEVFNEFLNHFQDVSNVINLLEVINNSIQYTLFITQ
jgi:hypothetical protein